MQAHTGFPFKRVNISPSVVLGSARFTLAASVVEVTPIVIPDYARLTEAGDLRITEDGSPRIIEQAV